MMRLIAFVFACMLLPSAVQSQALPSTVYPATVAGNVVTYAGTTANAANAASIVFGNPANGAVYAEASQAVGLPSGRSVPVVVRSSPSGPNVAKAIGNFARGVGGAALKTAGAVYAAAEIAKSLNDLCNELGYNCYKGADGTPSVNKSDPAVCSVGPCYKWKLTSPNGYLISSWDSSYAACVAAVNHYAQGGACVVADADSYNYKLPSGYLYTGVVLKTTEQIAANPAAYIPATIQDLEDKIASQSGWPSSSSLPETLKQAIASGQTLPLPTPTVTGPSTVQGPQTTQNTPAQNGQPASTKTTSTVYNVTYQGNTVTTNNVTTTVINNGTTTTTTTDTKEETPDPAPSDTANPDLPKLYTRQYPDGLTGVWTTRKAELMASSLGGLIQTMTPTISGSGGCPQFFIPAKIGPLVFGTGALGPPCAVWEFCKVVVLLTAAFLARALIFGG